MKIKLLQRVETQHKFYDPEADNMAFQKIEFAEGVQVDMTDTLPGWNKLAAKLIGLGYAEEVTGA